MKTEYLNDSLYIGSYLVGFYIFSEIIEKEGNSLSGSYLLIKSSNEVLIRLHFRRRRIHL